MNGTLLDSLPSALSIRGNGDFSAMVKVLSSSALMPDTDSINFCPNGSRLPQRSIEATQSAPFTGAPSSHFKPSRSLKLQLNLLSLHFQVSTICGCTFCSLSSSNSEHNTSY